MGNPPKWDEDPVNNEIYIWELNRMQQGETLLQAYKLTGDNRYARKVVDELLDWIEKCPCPEIVPQLEAALDSFGNVTPWRSLEVALIIIMLPFTRSVTHYCLLKNADKIFQMTI